MEVEVLTYGTVREAIGTKLLTRDVPEGTTVGELLGRLAQEFDGFGPDAEDAEDGDDPLIVRKNRKDIEHLRGRETPLEAGDRLSVSDAPVRD